MPKAKAAGKRKQKELEDEHVGDLSSSPADSASEGSGGSEAPQTPKAKKPESESAAAVVPQTPVKSPGAHPLQSPGPSPRTSKSRRNLEILRKRARKTPSPKPKSPKPTRESGDADAAVSNDPNGKPGKTQLKSKCQTKLILFRFNTCQACGACMQLILLPIKCD